MTRQTMIAALLAGLMALTAPVAARASSLLVDGGFEDSLNITGNWAGDIGSISSCTDFAIGCAPHTPFGEVRLGAMFRSAGNSDLAPSGGQFVGGVGPGLYEFGLWASLGIRNTSTAAGDPSQVQVSLLTLTSTLNGILVGTAGAAGAQVTDLSFAEEVAGFGGPYYHTNWFLLSGQFSLTQTETMIFNISLSADPRFEGPSEREGANSLQLFFDNAYLRKVEVEDPAAVIPLPAAGWLLLGALGALGALRRRRG